MGLLKNGIENEIKNLVIKYNKHCRGKGPIYVKVTINGNIIEILEKGILTNVGEILCKRNDIEEVERIWEKVREAFIEQALEDLNKVVGKKCEIISEISNFKEDFRKVTVKIAE